MSLGPTQYAVSGLGYGGDFFFHSSSDTQVDSPAESKVALETHGATEKSTTENWAAARIWFSPMKFSIVRLVHSFKLYSYIGAVHIRYNPLLGRNRLRAS